MTLILGIALALVCALASNVSMLLKQRGAAQAPSVDVRRPVRTAIGLWSKKAFAFGMLLGGAAWVVHVAAIALAPLSVVQAVLSGGIAVLGVMADRMFGHKVGTRQRIGLALLACGLVLLVITMPAQGGSHSSYALPAMIAFEAGLFALGALLIAGPRLGAPAEHHGLMLAAAAGVLFGVCNIGVKALTGYAADGVLAVVLSPWFITSLAASAVAFYASARSMQDGEAIGVIAITGTAANISCIAGGLVVFGDPMPTTALGIVLQGLAFVLVIVASALTPGPLKGAAPVAPAAAAARA